MNSLVRKLDRLLLLATFIALSLTGPGLHHLPVFGLHGDCCSRGIVATDCHHGSECTADVHEPSSISALAENDPCAVCVYYASGKLPITHFDSASSADPALDCIIVVAGSAFSACPSGHLARGPPSILS